MPGLAPNPPHVLTHEFSPHNPTGRHAVSIPLWQVRKPQHAHTHHYLVQVHSLSAKPGQYSVSGSWMLPLGFERSWRKHLHTWSERCCLVLFQVAIFPTCHLSPAFHLNFQRASEKAQHTKEPHSLYLLYSTKVKQPNLPTQRFPGKLTA